MDIPDSSLTSTNFQVIETSPKNRFSRFDKLLSREAFKSTYRALDNDTGGEVAWNSICTSEIATSEFYPQKALQALESLQHFSLVSCIKAWYNETKDEIVVITELVTGRPLRGHLRKLQSPRLRVIKLWCTEILSGLEFLHAQSPPVIHREVTCENIFINTATGRLKLGDLGLSVLLGSRCKGAPTNYLAPDALDGSYNTSTDIYSFGMCVLEICTLSTPYSECRNTHEIHNKLRSGVEPVDLELIEDSEVKEFIRICIYLRLTASQLKNHSFLVITEKDVNTVSLKSEASTGRLGIATEAEGTVLISLNIGVQDQDSGVVGKKIEFYYDLFTDAPEEIAGELINEFQLSPSYQEALVNVIYQKIAELKPAENSWSRYSSFGLRPSPFSVGSISPIESKEIDTFANYLTILHELDTFTESATNEGLSIGNVQKDDVLLLQRALSAVLGCRLKADGFFGRKTEWAVKRFQEENGLVVSGEVGKNLLELLMVMYERKSRWKDEGENLPVEWLELNCLGLEGPSDE